MIYTYNHFKDIAVIDIYAIQIQTNLGLYLYLVTIILIFLKKC